VRQKPIRGAADSRSSRLLRQQHPAQQRDVFEAAADDPQGVEIVALHLDADPAEFAKARLVPDDAAKGRRTDGRAAGLGPERQGHLEIRDGSGRAARRAARCMVGIMRVDRHTGVAVGEFGGHGLAEDDARRRADQGDAGGVGKRPVAAVDRRAVLGRHVDRIDDVLDPDGNAGQPPLASGAIYRARLDKRRFGIEPGPGLDVCAGSSLL
jgi:hypothetical protein